MNERIRELARKVDPELEKETIYCTANDLEKFAELIVRECALVIQKKIGPKSALDVLEHFGVEE